MLLFQGRADNIVPFQQATLAPFGGLWGSETIAASLKKSRLLINSILLKMQDMKLPTCLFIVIIMML